MSAEAGYSYKAMCMTGILIIFQLSVVSLCCEWHNGKEPFRLVIIRICVLNIVVVTEHCSLLKRHVRSPWYRGPGSSGIRLVGDFMLSY